MTIRAALEQHLHDLSPSFPTARENKDYKPVNGVAFQEIALLLNHPENPTIGGGFYRERGIFQVMLKYPLNGGPTAAEAKAKDIRDHFQRGITLSNAGSVVTVERTPTIGGGFIDEGRYCKPVSINFFSNVFA